MSPLASKSDLPSALWLKRKSEKIFEKNRKFWKFFWKFQNFRKFFADFRLSHRALGMFDFDARGLIRQEIPNTFRILIKHKSQNDLHTCGTQKTHHAKNKFFVPVVCSSQCAWCVHILGGARHLKVRHWSFQKLPPDLKSDKNSLL